MVQDLEQDHPVRDSHVPIMNVLYFQIFMDTRLLAF